MRKDITSSDGGRALKLRLISVGEGRMLKMHVMGFIRFTGYLKPWKNKPQESEQARMLRDSRATSVKGQGADCFC